jgi:dipeptidyl aminopeptidase/acylaminoacyl peptidase
MNWHTLAVFVLLTGALALAENPAAITDPQQLVSKHKDDLQSFTVERLFSTRTMGDTAWSPDGKRIVFSSNLGGRLNLFVLPADGGWPMQLTVSEQRQTSPAWSPNGKLIAYTSDRDGDEQWDVYVVSLGNGDVLNVSSTPAVSEESPVWSPDSRFLAWQAKPQTGSSYEIETYDLLLHRRRALTTNTPKELSNFRPLWSPDGKWIAYTQAHAGGRNSNVFVVEVATGKNANLTPHEGDKLYSVAAWSPDGKGLLITSNAQNGFQDVGLLDVASRQINWLTSGNWDSEAGSFSPDGKYLAWTTNIDGNQEIYLYDVGAKKATVLPIRAGVNSPGGADSAFSPDSSRLLYYHNGPEAANDAWVFDLASRQAKQLTHSMLASVRGEDMVEPYLVHYPSRDNKFILSAWVYVPYNQSRNGQTPAIVWVHGGPTAQSMNSFNRAIQFLVNQGYLVMAPNYRGSSGYGRDFMYANRFDMGGGDFDDVQAAADWVSKSGYVDPKKLVIMGGSYGGYMTMVGATRAPERWAAGVAIVPFVNWFTEVQHEDPLLQQYDLATMGDPEKNKALWQERSPINFVDRIKAPLLLMAGGNDPRCPKEEAQQVADAVRKNGGKVEFKVYENEGHGFARIENQIDEWKRVSEFLKFHVPAPGCGVGACEVP